MNAGPNRGDLVNFEVSSVDYEYKGLNAEEI
jgi:hypothetical protein